MDRSICLQSHFASKVQNTKNVQFISLSYSHINGNIVQLMNILLQVTWKTQVLDARVFFLYGVFLFYFLCVCVWFLGGLFCGLFVGVLSKLIQVLLFHITIAITDGDDKPLIQQYPVKKKNSDIQNQVPLSHAIL